MATEPADYAEDCSGSLAAEAIESPDEDNLELMLPSVGNESGEFALVSGSPR
jgi:hypothetical protein